MVTIKLLNGELLSIQSAESATVGEIKQTLKSQNDHFVQYRLRLVHSVLEEEVSNDSPIDARVTYWLLVQPIPRLIDYVLTHPQFKWNWGCISLHIPFEQLQSKNLVKDERLNWFHLSQNRSVTWEIVCATINELPWSGSGLSLNSNITYDHVLESERMRLAIDWSYDYLSSNPNITVDIVRRYPRKRWNYYHLAMNPSVTCEDVLTYPEMKWSTYFLSNNPNLTKEFVETLPECHWNWEALEKHSWSREIEWLRENIRPYETNERNETNDDTWAECFEQLESGVLSEKEVRELCQYVCSTPCMYV